tara:strand:+ start:410 stop:1255 length:846 start_codon:yes stop_codon:yes gene_type:complete
MFSILIATYNHLNYLKICLNSIKKNSKFKHQIIIHVNEGTDGTMQFLKKENYQYTFSKINEGVCTSYNKASELAKEKYIVIMQDDMYFCPNWDVVFYEEIKKIKHDHFFLSGTMIQPFKSYIELDCGSNYKDFNETKLLSENLKINYNDFQGTHWQPALLTKKIWDKVGGFSEEFSPGMGCDPDLNMKLWKEGIRIFKGLGNCRVYHFSSITLRKKNTSNNGTKIFLLKWGISIKFFKKFYLRTNEMYNGVLLDPIKNIDYYLALLICKIKYIYFKFQNKL